MTIRPEELLPVGGAVHLAFLWCDRCLPPWQISYIPIHQPPWNITNSLGARSRGDRFRCPGCQGAVSWHIHGPTWRPTYSYPDKRRCDNRASHHPAGQNAAGATEVGEAQLGYRFRERMRCGNGKGRRRCNLRGMVRPIRADGRGPSPATTVKWHVAGA